VREREREIEGGGERENTNNDWKKGTIENIHSRENEKESVGSSGNRAANFVDGFIGDGAAVTKRDAGVRERERKREEKGNNVVGRRS